MYSTPFMPAVWIFGAMSGSIGLDSSSRDQGHESHFREGVRPRRSRNVNLKATPCYGVVTPMDPRIRSTT
jgi:hypothetical protein